MARAGSADVGLVPRVVTRLGMLWLLGFNLRSVMLALAPVLPSIRTDLGVNYRFVGTLTAVSVFLLGLGAGPGALLANRFGSKAIISVCLAGLAGGALIRLLPPALPWLLTGTVVLSTSVALAQPSAAAILRSWFASSIERASAVYASGLLVGSLAAAVATPSLAALIGWRGTFWLWALPVLAILPVWLVIPASPRAARPPRLTRMHLLARDGTAWRAAILFGCQTVVLYTTLTWLPFRAAPAGNYAVTIGLLGITGGGLLPSLALAALPMRYATSSAFYAASSLVVLAGSIALVLVPPQDVWVGSVLLGIGAGMIFVGSMALPIIEAVTPQEVADRSALVLTVGCLSAFAGPLVGGVLVDLSDTVTLGFVPEFVAGIVALVAGMTFWRSNVLVWGRRRGTDDR